MKPHGRHFVFTTAAMGLDTDGIWTLLTSFGRITAVRLLVVGENTGELMTKPKDAAR